MMTASNITIVGAGLVGTSLAIALAQQGISVTLIESRPSQDITAGEGRAIALSYTSQLIFKALHLWEKLQPFAAPIDTIHVSQQHHYGSCVFTAKAHRVPSFGHVVPAQSIAAALETALPSLPAIKMIQPAMVTGLEYVNGLTQVAFIHEQKTCYHQTQLLVMADGGKANFAMPIPVKRKEHDYQQMALVATLTTAKPHNNVAYERLTQQGPLALLPLTQQQSALIWTVSSTVATELAAKPEVEFLAALQQQFGYRLGKLLTVGKRHIYPLRLMTADPVVQPGIVLLGNAAHTVHPLAGQGFNLALRDVAALAEILQQSPPDQLGSLAVLMQYEQWRQQDQANIIRFTDWTVRAFAQSSLLLKWLRTLGLVCTDLLPLAKKEIVRNLLGHHGRVPKLMCGLTLG